MAGRRAPRLPTTVAGGAVAVAARGVVVVAARGTVIVAFRGERRDGTVAVVEVLWVALFIAPTAPTVAKTTRTAPDTPISLVRVLIGLWRGTGEGAGGAGVCSDSTVKAVIASVRSVQATPFQNRRCPSLSLYQPTFLGIDGPSAESPVGAPSSAIEVLSHGTRPVCRISVFPDAG